MPRQLKFLPSDNYFNIMNRNHILKMHGGAIVRYIKKDKKSVEILKKPKSVFKRELSPKVIAFFR